MASVLQQMKTLEPAARSVSSSARLKSSASLAAPTASVAAPSLSRRRGAWLSVTLSEIIGSHSGGCRSADCCLGPSRPTIQRHRRADPPIFAPSRRTVGRSGRGSTGTISATADAPKQFFYSPVSELVQSSFAAPGVPKSVEPSISVLESHQ